MITVCVVQLTCYLVEHFHFVDICSSSVLVLFLNKFIITYQNVGAKRIRSLLGPTPGYACIIGNTFIKTNI